MFGPPYAPPRPFEPLLILAAIVCAAAHVVMILPLREVAALGGVPPGWSHFLLGGYLFLASSALAALATAKVWWQGHRRQAGVLAAFVFVRGLSAPWMVNLPLSGHMARGFPPATFDCTASGALALAIVGVLLGHMLVAQFTRSIQVTRPRACTGALVVVWLICATLPVLGARTLIARDHARDLAKGTGALPVSVTEEDPSAYRCSFWESIIRVNAAGKLEVVPWWEAVSEPESPGSREPESLAAWSRENGHRIGDDDVPQLVLAPEASCEELTRALRAVRASLPILRYVLLDAVNPTHSPALLPLLALQRDLPFKVIPLRLDPPAGAMVLTVLSDENDAFEFDGTVVHGPENLADAVAHRSPACLIVSAPPTLALQDLVHVLDAVRRTPGVEVVVR